MKPFIIYLILINAAGLLLMLIDKFKAKKNLWRIPEASLLWVAVAGGSVGIIAGMRLFRHKTLHLKFSLGVPLILAVQVIVCILLLI